MVFSSITFLFAFLPIILILYFIVPLHYRNAVLFIVSLLFYGWGEPRYILIMLMSTIVDYFNGYQVHKYLDNKKIAKRFVIFSIIFNLSVLGFFKYYDFVAVNINLLGFGLPLLGLSLPIGISFYTFQTMSYPIDVYRGDAKYQKNIISFGTYVTMFPQLIAGPIVRYKDIDQQLNSRDYSTDKFYRGVTKFMSGLVKKVLLANNIGILWDVVSTASVANNSLVLVWLGVLAFSFQIYFDFSGYSDMAIGLARMLGFELLENFNYPYISKSITDFWRRWHISLSTWFRDYVYIPLGGNQKGLKKQLLNILFVWFLTGVWHGASWNYILWGVYFGVLLIVEKLGLLKILKRLPSFVQHFYSLFFIAVGWMIFANEDFGVMNNYLQMMFGFKQLPFINDLTKFYLRDNLVLILMLILASTPVFKRFYRDKIEKTHYDKLMPILVLVGLIFCVAYLVDGAYNPFLYFRF
jgi:alginate O-acetyltransferase complex protein AlgI